MTARAAAGGAGADLRSDEDITVGIVGPHALLERIVLAAGLPGPAGGSLHVSAGGADDDSLRCRLLTAPYADEQEAPRKAARLGAADACLFASQAPLAYARRAGLPGCPAVPIELADGPLIAAMLRARQAGADPARASFDTFSRLEVTHALAELSVPAHRVHVREEIATPAAMASYHVRLWQLGQTSAAITCLDEVARRLAASQVPVIAVRPSDHAIAAALRTAILLAQRRVLAAAQLAVALVEVPALRDGPGQRRPRQDKEELRLAVHGFLVHEAGQIDAAVSPVSEHGFLVVATRSSLTSVPEGELPFTAGAARKLGIVLDVAVGAGRTEREAEEAARQRLPPAASAGTAGRPRARTRLTAAIGTKAAAGTGPGTGPTQLAAADSTRAGGADDSLSRLRSLATLARLAQKLTAGATPVVDAELTGQLLSVTPRTARRQLRALADEGLALPLPPRRSPHPGRPRQSYRLVVEKLDREAAR